MHVAQLGCRRRAGPWDVVAEGGGEMTASSPWIPDTSPGHGEVW